MSLKKVKEEGRGKGWETVSKKIQRLEQFHCVFVILSPVEFAEEKIAMFEEKIENFVYCLVRRTRSEMNIIRLLYKKLELFW